jgi:hypothetical protein
MNETNEISGANEEEAFNAEAAAEKIIVSAEEAAIRGLQSGGDEMEAMEVALAPLEGKVDSNGDEVRDTEKSTTHSTYAENEAIDVPLRPEEKKRLRWEGGLYLAPLTTVGNLVSASARASGSWCAADLGDCSAHTCSAHASDMTPYRLHVVFSNDYLSRRFSLCPIPPLAPRLSL